MSAQKLSPVFVVLVLACGSPPMSGTASSTTTESGEHEGTGTGGSESGDSTGPDPEETSTDEGGTETEDGEPECGNGTIESGEECDDGNPDDHDDCTSDCVFPRCDDGVANGDESDVDCGGTCSDCMEGLMCHEGAECTTLACVEGECRHAVSCRQLKELDMTLTTGHYTIDIDGPGETPPFQVLCEMGRDGGGWTLTMVASDDGNATWTWSDRSLMGLNQMLVGNLSDLSSDYKSLAHHTVGFTDLLFVHAPSDVWAAYYDVGDGTLDFGTFMAIQPYPVCDDGLAGQGFEMGAGTLLLQNKLCDTMLYFHAGDHDAGVQNCPDNQLVDNGYGPTWNMYNNNPCPFDDTTLSALGPNGYGPAQNAETAALGYGFALGLNTGEPGAGENYMQVYVR